MGLQQKNDKLTLKLNIITISKPCFMTLQWNSCLDCLRREIAFCYSQNMLYCGRPRSLGQLRYWSDLITVYSTSEGSIILVVGCTTYELRSIMWRAEMLAESQESSFLFEYWVQHHCIQGFVGGKRVNLDSVNIRWYLRKAHLPYYFCWGSMLNAQLFRHAKWHFNIANK